MKSYAKLVFLSLLVVFCSTLVVGDSSADLPVNLIMNWEWPYEGTSILTLYCLPDGSGSSFAQARDAAGCVVDATMSGELWRGCVHPVSNYPAEDMWLATRCGGLKTCAGGSIPDVGTDENGFTMWSAPLKAGGWSTDVCQIEASGETMAEPEPLRFNSADINGDLKVDLDDLGIFTTIYYDSNAYDFAIDFEYDGGNDLADVSVLADSYGARCP